MYSEGSNPSKQWRNKPPAVNGSAREEIIAKMKNVYNVLAVQFAGFSGINLIKYSRMGPFLVNRYIGKYFRSI